MANYPSKMNSAEFQAMMAELSEAESKFIESHNAFTNMLNKERTRDIVEQNRKSIQPIGYLKNGGDFLMWSDRLINVLKKVYLHNYILMEVPEPANEDEIEDWKKDRVAIEEYIRKSVPDGEVWTALQGMGWDINEQNPKSTFDKLTEYFYTDSDENNFLLHKELVNMDVRDYDDFLAFYVRLNYLHETLSKSGHWKLSEKAATMCALKAIARAYPYVYIRSITKARNNKLSWADLMVEFRALLD